MRLLHHRLLKRTREDPNNHTETETEKLYKVVSYRNDATAQIRDAGQGTVRRSPDDPHPVIARYQSLETARSRGWRRIMNPKTVAVNSAGRRAEPGYLNAVALDATGWWRRSRSA